MRADQRVAVVTGGAQGIGEAIARRFAEVNYALAILDLQDSGQRVADDIVQGGGCASFYKCDLTDIGQVREVANQVEHLGPLGALVNNAGWSSTSPFLDQDPAVWARTIAINYTAVLNVCHAFGPQLNDDGAIVNVASDAARIGVAGQAVYAGAKAAVIGFSKSLAVELAKRGVRVNVVCPGTTRTPLLESMFSEEDIAKRVRIIPLRRLAMPEDLAKTVVFLATEATHVTGQVISVSGGASRVG
ncbi:MAG: SDR family oxidoreductase [Betaproteobacteria bacterium]|nr:SDR family oxidoreductase [Betaproteobacteria bacterium]